MKFLSRYIYLKSLETLLIKLRLLSFEGPDPAPKFTTMLMHLKGV